MKKIFIIVLTIFFYNSLYAQKTETDTLNIENVYTVDFVYSGKVKNEYDSVFYIQYTFKKKDFNKFNKIVLEDSLRTTEINLSNPESSNDILIKYLGNKVFLIKKNVDPNNVPILVYSEDKSGHRLELLESTQDGEFRDARKIKEIRKSAKVAERMNE